MYTLLLRLAGPMQSWGTSSKFDIRGTGPEPSKSAIVGLMAAALGRKRDDPIHDLAALHIGVRADQPGSLERDFQVVVPDIPKRVKEESHTTTRYYLSDAVFLAGVESPDIAFLERIEYALKRPVFHLYLGRKSYPPTLPLVIGIRNGELEEVLQKEPRLAGTGDMRIVMDAEGGYDTITRDCPLSFDPDNRRYTSRFTKEFILVAHDAPSQPSQEAAGGDHDAFAQL